MSSQAHIPSLRLAKSSTESMNLISAPAMKLSGFAEIITAALTLASFATLSCIYKREGIVQPGGRKVKEPLECAPSRPDPLSFP